jgi:hypothetical protein
VFQLVWGESGFFHITAFLKTPVFAEPKCFTALPSRVDRALCAPDSGGALRDHRPIAKTPYSFSLSSNFGRLGVAMDLRSMIANVQAEPKVSLTIL